MRGGGGGGVWGGGRGRKEQLVYSESLYFSKEVPGILASLLRDTVVQISVLQFLC